MHILSIIFLRTDTHDIYYSNIGVGKFVEKLSVSIYGNSRSILFENGPRLTINLQGTILHPTYLTNRAIDIDL